MIAPTKDEYPSWHPLAYATGQFRPNRARQIEKNVLRKTKWHKLIFEYGYYRGRYTYVTRHEAVSLQEAYRMAAEGKGIRNYQGRLSGISGRMRISGLVRPEAHGQARDYPGHVARRLAHQRSNQASFQPCVKGQYQLVFA